MKNKITKAMVSTWTLLGSSLSI